jgi:hypothetical protein
MTIPAAIRATACLALGLLAGCDLTDPYRRPGMWHPDGANDANIAAMVADPHDLISGQDAQNPGRKTGAAAVDRLWQNKPTPLLTGAPPSQGGTDAAPPATPPP